MPHDPADDDMPPDYCPACEAGQPHEHIRYGACPHDWGDDDMPACCIRELQVQAAAYSVIMEAQRILREYNRGRGLS